MFWYLTMTDGREEFCVCVFLVDENKTDLNYNYVKLTYATTVKAEPTIGKTLRSTVVNTIVII